MTSLSGNSSSVVTSVAISTAKISNPQAKSPTVKSNSIAGDTFGNSQQHPELHQTNSTSNQLLTTSIIRKPITSSTFDNKTVQNNINYIATASNPSLTQHQLASKQVAGPSSTTAQSTLTAIPLYDPSSDLIKNSASNVVNNNNSINFHNNINVLNNANSNQLPNNLDFDPIDGCTSYYSNNRTNEVLNNSQLHLINVGNVQRRQLLELSLARVVRLIFPFHSQQRASFLNAFPTEKNILRPQKESEALNDIGEDLCVKCHSFNAKPRRNFAFEINIVAFFSFKAVFLLRV